MKQCNVAIAGLGVVGAQTARLLLNNQSSYATKTGATLTLKAVSARSKGKDRGFDISSLHWCDNPVDLASMDDIDIVVEVMGGSDGPALALTKAALSAGKHVVTANKAMIALHGMELAKLAEDNNAQLCFESSVAGGIPALKILREGLAANDIQVVSGILNGTCNYILSTMEQTGRAFDDVLSEAQALGYAEADPTFDVDGIDAAHKLAILQSIAFAVQPNFDNLSITGIRAITDMDISYAAELGYRIRLIGRATAAGDAGVAPMLLPMGSALASVTGPTNAVNYEATPVQTISAMGPGAGAGPTASAVVADIMDIASGRNTYPFGRPAKDLASQSANTSTAAQSSYYLRLRVTDEKGVLADVTDVLNACDMSIETLVQKQLEGGQDADLVMILHEASSENLAKACDKLKTMSVVGDMSLPMAVQK